MPHESTVQSVAKAMTLLDTLLEAGVPLKLSELSERSGWPQSTVYGLLSTMRDFTVVEQNPDGRYCLGVRLFEFGCAVSGSWNASEVARPYLQHLSAKTGESVVLSMLSHGKVLSIDQVQSRASLRVVSDIGTRLPLHCTSQGKVFLAAMPPADAARILKAGALPAYTPHTLTNWADFERELPQVREQGYAVENGEYKIGLRSVSAPVRVVSGRVQYAVGVVGMFRRVQSQEFQDAIFLTRDIAGQISLALGYRAPAPLE